MFEPNEPGTQVLVKVPRELGDILGCGELAFCHKAAYGRVPRSDDRGLPRLHGWQRGARREELRRALHH